jgi:flagellar basal body-associated protein FliL
MKSSSYIILLIVIVITNVLTGMIVTTHISRKTEKALGENKELLLEYINMDLEHESQQVKMFEYVVQELDGIKKK